MPRKPKPSSFNLRPAIAGIGTCALVAVVYFAVVWVGDQAKQSIADRPRFQVKFDDIQCLIPPGMDRATFLTEVRYLSKFPSEFSSLETETPAKLAAAFVKHPWVKDAQPAAWPKGVDLVFRSPALVITTPQGDRVVDDTGVLLPTTSATAGVAKLLAPQPLPNMSAGELWKSRDVQRAVELVKDYGATTIERSGEGWKIRQNNGRTLTLSR